MELLIKIESNKTYNDIINVLMPFKKVKWIQVKSNNKVKKTIINNSETIQAMSNLSKKHLSKYITEETESIF